MKKGRRNRQHAKFARLRRHLDISLDLERPRRIRTRSARYAAALGEQLGLITRPKCCAWCRRRLRLERHHWNYDEPLNVTYLCVDCHAIADTMVWGCGVRRRPGGIRRVRRDLRCASSHGSPRRR